MDEGSSHPVAHTRRAAPGIPSGKTTSLKLSSSVTGKVA